MENIVMVLKGSVFSLQIFLISMSALAADIAHDIFEGILPVELAHCFNLLIGKKYFPLDKLNESFQRFGLQVARQD